MAALVSACAAADSLFVPNLVGQDIYHAHRALRKLGLVSRFEQVKADTAKVPLFFVASQAPDSGAAANPGDTVVRYTVQLSKTGFGYHALLEERHGPSREHIAHPRGRRKDGKTPACQHLIEVGQSLCDRRRRIEAAGLNADYVIALGLLHDTLEEYPELISELREQFGDKMVED